jgi:hypothetical protein
LTDWAEWDGHVAERSCAAEAATATLGTGAHGQPARPQLQPDLQLRTSTPSWTAHTPVSSERACSSSRPRRTCSSSCWRWCGRAAYAPAARCQRLCTRSSARSCRLCSQPWAGPVQTAGTSPTTCSQPCHCTQGRHRACRPRPCRCRSGWRRSSTVLDMARTARLRSQPEHCLPPAQCGAGACLCAPWLALPPACFSPGSLWGSLRHVAAGSARWGAGRRGACAPRSPSSVPACGACRALPPLLRLSPPQYSPTTAPQVTSPPASSVAISGQPKLEGLWFWFRVRMERVARGGRTCRHPPRVSSGKQCARWEPSGAVSKRVGRFERADTATEAGRAQRK